MIESGTVGRWDDMVKIKGENVFPPEVDAIVFARPAIGEYQADVFIGERGRDEAAIRVGLAQEHLGTPAAADLLDQLRHELKQRTNITFELQAVPLSDLPQYTTPDAKPRRWTDRRQDHLRESTTGAA
jgi:phenylacetate-CoA ligase